MAKKLILSLFIFIGLSFAANCSLDAFIKSCNECSFDANGKMDENCRKDVEGEGTSCLAFTYPMMSLKHQLGSCPQIDECVERLKSCKNLATTGSDAKDCSSQSMKNCFVMGDKCVEAADKVCSGGKTEEEAGFDDSEAGGPGFNPIEEVPPEDSEETITDFMCGGLFVLFMPFIFLRKLDRI